jgi:hypothetical protein
MKARLQVFDGDLLSASSDFSPALIGFDQFLRQIVDDAGNDGYPVIFSLLQGICKIHRCRNPTGVTQLPAPIMQT